MDTTSDTSGQSSGKVNDVIEKDKSAYYHESQGSDSQEKNKSIPDSSTNYDTKQYSEQYTNAEPVYKS